GLNGGAISGQERSSIAVMNGSVILGNHAEMSGGGLYCMSLTSGILDAVEISGNSAVMGGGIGMVTATFVMRGRSLVFNNSGVKY
ncbi:hypothetical protein CYMTET_34271, partial [Cymbomonas tetramitiformis]